MGSWSSLRLGDVIDLKRGYDLPTSDREAGDVPVVSSAGVSGSHSQAKVAGPGVVIGRYGTLGLSHFVDRDFWPLNTTLYVRDFKGNEPRFVKYLLEALSFDTHNDKSSVPGVNRNDLHRVMVRLPPIHEQRAIAAVLGALDDKMELNGRTNRIIVQGCRLLFNQMAVADVGHDARAVSLGDVVDVLETGKRPRGGVRHIARGIPSVGAESIKGVGDFDFTKTKFVDAEYFRSMKRGIVSPWDVLLYKDGGRPGEFEPHVTLVGDGFPFDEYCINEHVYRLRADRLLSPSYLYFSLSSDETMEEMRRRGTGVAVPGLNSTAVRSLSVRVPPPPKLALFEARVRPMLERVFVNSTQSRTLSELRDLLLPKLISGDLRVRDAESLASSST